MLKMQSQISDAGWQLPGLLLLVLLLPSFCTVGTPAIRPQSQRGIIFPKESFDDCFMDEQRSVRGSCQKLQDCPEALERWHHEKLAPKTCYFVKFDHFVCCALDEANVATTTTRTTGPLLDTTTAFPDPFIIPSVQRSSLLACYGYYDARPNPEAKNEIELPFGISVVGGTATKYHEFPFMAALGWRSNYDQSIFYRCGGALIAPSYVLTAAHCIDFGGDLPVTVRLGGDNLTLADGDDFKIKRVIIHPEYSAKSAYNDIALLELDTLAAASLRPACLWSSAQLAHQQLTAIGYGQTRFAGLASAQLLKASLSGVSNSDCAPHYQQDALPQGLSASQLCADDPAKLRDTCQGDSGGPLIMQHGPFRYVVGVTSLGQGCANGPPSIYTRVSSFVDWIESIVWPSWPSSLPPQSTALLGLANIDPAADVDLRVDV